MISDKFGSCGINKYLRVRETPTWNNGRGDGCHKLNTWDMVVFPECMQLADEMVRPQYSKMKKTVCIWNAEMAPYPEPWVTSGGQQISGEIFLKPTRKVNKKILTVIIFHHGKMDSYQQVQVPNLAAAGNDKCELNKENIHHESLLVSLYPISSHSNSLVTSDNDNNIDGSYDRVQDRALVLDEKNNEISDAETEVM